MIILEFIILLSFIFGQIILMLRINYVETVTRFMVLFPHKHIQFIIGFLLK